MNLPNWLNQQSEELYTYQNEFKLWAEPLLAEGAHPGYTDHTINHSLRIIEYLGQLVEPLFKSSPQINDFEVFILLVSAYSHDIGMQDQRGDQSLEDIRITHHELSGAILKELNRFRQEHKLLPFPIPSDEILDLIAIVAKGHRKVDLYSEEYGTYSLSGKQIRLRLLAALHKFADELEVESRRGDLSKTLLQKLPPENQIH